LVPGACHHAGNFTLDDQMAWCADLIKEAFGKEAHVKILLCPDRML